MQLNLVNKTIEALTKDQFQIITWLRDKKRAAISGCAGSGKTLVAAEKAIRLARAGLNVLILCHSANLSTYIENLTKNTGVQVFDFTSWIKSIAAKNLGKTYSAEWTHFEEPTDEELSIGFDIISASTAKYDAIIVDEGQDFRDTWWLIIEEALDSPQHGLLYIFLDDNQALLPNRSKYPIETAPFQLSKNCRNSGKVFRLVKLFHAQAPEESMFLSNKGILEYKKFHTDKEGIDLVCQAVSNSLKILKDAEIVVLTTESDPASESILNGVEVYINSGWSWQETVSREISEIARYMRKLSPNNSASIDELKNLSKSLLPTESDIQLVISVVQRISEGHANLPNSSSVYQQSRWSVNAKWLTLRLEHDSIPGKIAYFRNSHWAEKLPEVTKYKIMPAEKIRKDANHIALYTVSGFKGLESDGVIRFVRSLRSEMTQNLYVGSSRSRFFLSLVANDQIAYLIPNFQTNQSFFWWNDIENKKFNYKNIKRGLK